MGACRSRLTCPLFDRLNFVVGEPDSDLAALERSYLEEQSRTSQASGDSQPCGGLSALSPKHPETSPECLSSERCVLTTLPETSQVSPEPCLSVTLGVGCTANNESVDFIQDLRESRCIGPVANESDLELAVEESPPSSLLVTMEEARARGNMHFDAKRLDEAVGAYDEGLRLCESGEVNADDVALMRAVGLLHSNSAEVFLKQGVAAEAFQAAASAIERLQSIQLETATGLEKGVIQKDLLKACLRKSRAQAMLARFDDALATLCSLPVEEQFLTKGRQGVAVAKVRAEVEDQRALACSEMWAVNLRKGIAKAQDLRTDVRSSAAAHLIAWSTITRALTAPLVPREQAVRLLRLLDGIDLVVAELQDQVRRREDSGQKFDHFDECHVLRVLWFIVSAKEVPMQELERSTGGSVAFAAKIFNSASSVSASSCWALAVLAELLPSNSSPSWSHEFLPKVLQHLRIPHSFGGATDLPGGPQAAALRVLASLEPGSSEVKWLATNLPPFSEWWPAVALASKHFDRSACSPSRSTAFSINDDPVDACCGTANSGRLLPRAWWDALHLVARCCVGATTSAEVTKASSTSHIEGSSMQSATPWWSNLPSSSSSTSSSKARVAWPWRDRHSMGQILLVVISLLRISAPAQAMRSVERMKLLRRLRLGVACDKLVKGGQMLLSMQPTRVLYFDSSLAGQDAVAWAAMALSLLACQAKCHVGLTAGTITVLGAWPALSGLCVPTAPPELYTSLMCLLVSCAQLPACAQRLAQLGLGTVLLAPPSLRERLARRSASAALASETILGARREEASASPVSHLVGLFAGFKAPLPVMQPCREGRADLPWALLLCRLSQHSAFHAHLGLALERPSDASSVQSGVATIGTRGGLPHCMASEDAKASAETLVDVLLHCLEDQLRDTTVSVTTAVIHTLRLLTNVAPSCLDEMPCEHFAAAVRKAERCSATPQGAPLANELLALLSELRLVRGPLVRAWSAHVRERGTLWERWLFDRVVDVTKTEAGVGNRKSFMTKQQG